MSTAASWVAVALLCGVACFQVALALGAPYGDATMGGRADTVDGVLTGRFRAIAACSALVLVGLAVVVRLDGPSWPKWVIAALLTANAVANLRAPQRLERSLFGPVALVAAAATALVAVS